MCVVEFEVVVGVRRKIHFAKDKVRLCPRGIPIIKINKHGLRRSCKSANLLINTQRSSVNSHEMIFLIPDNSSIVGNAAYSCRFNAFREFCAQCVFEERKEYLRSHLFIHSVEVEGISGGN